MYGVNKALGGVVSFPQFDGGGLSALHMHNPNNGQSISNEDLVMKLLQYYADKITAETGLRDNVTAQDVYDLSGRDAELTEITLAAACFRIASSWSFKDIKEKTDDALEQKFTEQTADALGLALSVANIPDGTVSIERVLKKWQEFEDESEDDFKELLAGIRTAQVGKQIYHLLNSESIKS